MARGKWFVVSGANLGMVGNVTGDTGAAREVSGRLGSA